MRRNATKVAAVVMSLAVTMTSVNLPTTAAAATKKVKLNKTKATLTVGKTTTLKVTKGGKAVKATFKSSNAKVAKVVTKSGKSTKIKALKKGTAKITATYAKKKYTCKITVKAKKVTTPTTAPTVAPTVEPTVEPTVAPTTTPATVGAITTTVENTISGYDNTVLAGSLVKMSVKLTDTNGSAIANKEVTGYITDTTNENLAWGNSYKFDADKTVRVATTDENGVATFVLATPNSLKNTDVAAVSGYNVEFTSGSMKANATFSVAALEYSVKKDAVDMSIKETTPDANKVKGLNNEELGTSSYRGVETKGVDGKKKIDYVSSQQVSEAGKNDHAVSFDTAVNIVIPEQKLSDNVYDKEVQPIDESVGVSGKYNTYTHTDKGVVKFSITNKDAVKYATLFFDSINVSKHTTMSVYPIDKDGKIVKEKTIKVGAKEYKFSTLIAGYNYVATTTGIADSGANVAGYDYNKGIVPSLGDKANGNKPLYWNTADVKFFKDTTEFYNTTSQGLQIWKDVLNEYSGVAVVLDSEGQVNVDNNNGYKMKNITYVYDTAVKSPKKREVLKSVDVKWDVVTPEFTTKTEYKDGVGIASGDIINETAGEKATYTMPVFPYVGNAIITVTNSNNVPIRYYAVPTEHTALTGSNNVNIIDSTKTPYLITKDEATAVLDTKLETKDTSVTVNSEKTGTTYLQATYVSNDPNVKLDASNKNAYTSVMWNPIPKKSNKTKFVAIEGQTIDVVAQLYDKNDNRATKSGVAVTFFAGDTADIKLDSRVGNGNNTDTAATSYKNAAKYPYTNLMDARAVATKLTRDGVTDENGEVTLSLKADELVDVIGLFAKTNSTEYNLKLKINGQTVDTAANLYWLQLGIKYKDEVDGLDNWKSTISSNANGGVETVNVETGKREYKANETWDVATVADVKGLCLDGGFKADKFAINNGVKINVAQDNGSVATLVKTDNGMAEIHSKADGAGTLVYTMDNQCAGTNVEITNDGTKCEYAGVGATSVDEKMNIKYSYGLLGTKLAFVTPAGTKVARNNAHIAYVQLKDSFGNINNDGKIRFNSKTATIAPVVGTDYTMDANGTITVKTDDYGVACVEFKQKDNNYNPIITATYNENGNGSEIVADCQYTFVDHTDLTKFPNFGVALVKDKNGNEIPGVLDVKYQASATSNDTIKLTFTDDIMANTASILAIYNTSKVSIKDGDDVRKYSVTNAAVSGKTLTLTINAHRQDLSDDAVITVNFDEVNVDGIPYALTAKSGKTLTGSVSFVKESGAEVN